VTKRPLPRGPGAPSGIIELESFSTANLSQWQALSRDLDEFQAILFFGIRPEQRRLRSELIGALQEVGRKSLSLNNWHRIVPYRYSNEPLSCAGSLQYVGGRFNAGVDLDQDTLSPWPALYLAENFETAFRERFQLRSEDQIDGLTAQELDLQPGSSLSGVNLHGQLHSVFDITSPKHLNGIARVLKRIKMPQRAKQLKAKLKSGAFMIQTAAQLFEAVCKQNWRPLPIQFGLPAISQVLAELIRAADYEAILYPSSKGEGKCLAVFPDKMDSASYIELADPSPGTVKQRRLDANTSGDLQGWDSIPPQFRPR
jgi:RES domain